MENVTMEYINNLVMEQYPYIKYLSNACGYADGNILKIDDMPDNFIDYMIVDGQYGRVSSINMFTSNGSEYSLEITVNNYEYNLSLEYKYIISAELHDKIQDKMEDNYGEPEHVDYPLIRDTFKVLKGGKCDE